MKNKNLIIGIVIAVVVILAIVLAVVLLNNKKENVNIDLTALNSELTTKGKFDEMATQDIDKDILATLYGVEDKEAVAEVIGKMPMMNIQASMFLVVKAADGKVDYVKEEIEAYGKQFEEQWATYLPAQYDLVKARKLGVKGNYVYLIIAENAEELAGLVK